MKKWQDVADRVTVKSLLSWSGHIRVPGKRPSRRLIFVNHLVQGVVWWNGDVSFCCIYIDSRDDSSGILGNVAHESLEAIFLGKKRQRFIKGQLRGDYSVVPLCKGCPD